MSTLLATIASQGPIDRLVEMVLATCNSPATRRMYATYLRRFIESGAPLTREGVALYLQQLRDAGTGIPTLMGASSAIKKLANEAHMRQLIDFECLHGIESIKSPKYQKQRSGNWLTITQVQALLAIPDRSTYWGKRDACILSLMVGCGLRRAEMATLEWERHYLERDGRMCLVDFVGKGSKTRTVPVPSWAQADADSWYIASREPAPPPGPDAPFYEHGQAATRRVDSRLITGGLSYESIAEFVKNYGVKLGVDLSSHDLRRTLAQMLRRAGAPLEQIQYTLGHSDIATTVLYLGSQLELAPGKAAVDVLGINNPVYCQRGIPMDAQDTLYAHLQKERRAIRAIQTIAEKLKGSAK